MHWIYNNYPTKEPREDNDRNFCIITYREFNYATWDFHHLEKNEKGGFGSVCKVIHTYHHFSFFFHVGIDEIYNLMLCLILLMN